MPWMGFFSSVSVDRQQWTPVITGLTDNPTISANWTRFGPKVRIWGSFTGSTAASNASLTLPFKCSDSSSAQFWNPVSKTLIGNGYMSGGTLYFPDWSDIGSVEFFGEYQLETV